MPPDMIELSNSAREHSGKAHPPHPQPQPLSQPPTPGNSAQGLHSHGHDHEHGHGHSHGVLGHSHAHGEEDGHGLELIETLEAGGDKGQRITIIGLVANIILTTAKGLAGWFMNSAALLAEAETAQALPAGPVQAALENATSIVHNIPAVVGGGHTHAPTTTAAGVLDPNAAWFAAVSVVAKEWLFRITRKVATEESSPVLMANAYHHRSDAYSSAVALVAILGSTFFPALPLDPIGGLVVSAVIIRQGAQIFAGAFKEITDASASAPTLRTLERSLDSLTHAQSILGVDSLRARRAGSHLFVDLNARVRPEVSAGTLAHLEESIAGAIKEARKDVKEVAVRFVPVEQMHPPPPSAPCSPSTSASASMGEDERPLSPVSLDEKAPRAAPAPPSRTTSPRTSREEA
ncbi:unnamed protein product [Peniophora sp. CBMAI 1063]|nr:unnamed protein product [Peniophora sp. CBMAI 1063]